MITKYSYTRLLFYFVILSLMISSCTETGVQQTRSSILGKAEAATLLGDMSMEEAAPALYAISAVVSGASKDVAYMVFNETQQIAVFVSRGGPAPTGGNYTYIATVDTAHGGLLNTLTAFQRMGLRLGDIKTFGELKAALRMRGFTELTVTALPLLAQTIRLGIGFLKSVGGTMSHILVVPAGVLTPEMMYPWETYEGDPQ